MQEIRLYNSMSGKKETFKPIHEGHVGMYVCGPTVYSDVHLGNCRTFVNFDVIFRYLKYAGYKVRYVRNITDVGHLLDDGEDRIARGARLDNLEPMEVVQKYANGFQHMMRIFNTLAPSIEPRATGHIIEQIEMVQAILDNGLAYESNGSVYFDTTAFIEKKAGGEEYNYGDLSGRDIEDLFAETRDLKSQDDKKHPSDFAIWMKASPEHIMRWNSPWSEGFPGWHLECSAMSTKYLGKRFDIHGGGNDLKFPHHENEIAQNVGSCKSTPCNYWLHANMLLMNGRKMSKSDGNTISPQELFSGDSVHVTKGYDPMVIRFFFLQSHYRSTLDLTDDALLAAEKGYKRLMDGLKALHNLSSSANDDGAAGKEVLFLLDKAHGEMNDDFNTPMALATCFELTSLINSLRDGHRPIAEISTKTLSKIREGLTALITDVFGLKPMVGSDHEGALVDNLMQVIIDIRQKAREEKNWVISDQIRDALLENDIQVKDGKDGATWSFK